MPLFFGNKRESRSIADTIRNEKKKSAEEVKAEITNALIETDTQKELYRVAAQRAIQKAKKAIASQNFSEKAIAYKELKFAYGVYHYMDTLHMAFRTIESQMQMQEMTQSFAHVVNSLKNIHVPANNVNFSKLTATALEELDSVDLNGLDEMVNQLINGTIRATEATSTSDTFLDELVNGTATLDTPFPEMSHPQNAANNEVKNSEETRNPDNEELIAMLEQINAGLRG